MSFSRALLSRIVTAVWCVLLAPLTLHAQQTITATAGQVGVAYSYQVTSSATPPLQYAATGLPAGLAINASSGLITGIPTTPGTTVGTVSVTSNGQTNSAGISITIAAAANTAVISSPTTAAATVGVFFTYSASATNSPTSYNITGLPTGLSANSTTGVISGTPVAAGASSITLSANNAAGTGAHVTLTLTVAAPAAAPSITSAGTASGAQNDPFSYTIAATNTPTSFAASGLPLGLSLDTATGAITGTPTVAGVYTVGLTATNSSGSSATFNLVITIGSLSVITSSTAETAVRGVAYTYTTTASPAATSFNISGLPAGLTANTSTGVISGTPAAAAVGVWSVNLSANNATGSGPVSVLTLTVGAVPVINAASASGIVGRAFSYTISATNSPTGYAVVGLPSGLTLNPVTGSIAGSPTVTGTFSVSMTATNTFGTSPAATLTLTITSGGGGGGSGGGGGGGGGRVRPTITSANAAAAAVGEPFAFAVTTTPAATIYSATGLPEGIAINPVSGLISGTAAETGTYPVLLQASNLFGTTAQIFTLTVNLRPSVTLQPRGGSVKIGGSFALTVTATGLPLPTYQWLRNGVAIAGATGSSLTLSDFRVRDAGSYAVVITNVAGSLTSEVAVVGVDSTAKVEGSGDVVGNDIHHPDGNIYDQVLLTGSSAMITADPGQVTRVSFIDLDNDIVQVEFSGAGTLALSLENAAGPSAPAKYNQPGVSYMKGHASLVITGANESTNVSIFSVGPLTAVNQALFKPGETYDSIADVRLISISSSNGKFGGIRTANAAYFHAVGLTGVYAPGVAMQGPVFIGEITADDSASPVLVFGATTDVRITGGDLLQLNNRAVQVNGITHLAFVGGVTSSNIALPAQTNRGRFEEAGVDVTEKLVAPTD